MNLVRAFCVLLALMNLYGHVKAQTQPPLPAPGLYVTSNYGLMAKIPKGLTYCPLPEGWEGSDHGTVLFIEPPSGCIPSSLCVLIPSHNEFRSGHLSLLRAQQCRSKSLGVRSGKLR